MSQKTAYLWGPLSSFSAPLAAWLVNQGWHVHIATKPSFNLFSLSPLDLASSVRNCLEECLGGRHAFRAFQGHLKFLENDPTPSTEYDAFIFCGLPPNFDEARVPRAPWTASELARIAKILKGVPIFVVSSLWGAIQADGVVPEELEFERRKAKTHWERICQSYEFKLLDNLPATQSSWYFVRIPMIAGSTTNGETVSFTGVNHLFSALDPAQNLDKTVHDKDKGQSESEETIKLTYNPDSTFWFLPLDHAVHMFWRLLEDSTRPRICNIVSTQATLNREWIGYLAESLGIKEIVPAEKDRLSLPSDLRKMLQDNVQVRTRNLFEVAGKYHLSPVKFEKEYFDKVVQAGRRKRWGLSSGDTRTSFQSSKQLASYYFEHFIPTMVTDHLLRKVTMNGATVGFILKDSGGLGWVLKSPNGNGKVVVERYDRGAEKPRICFKCSGQTMSQLIFSKLPWHRALLLREIEVEGPLLDAIRISSVIDRFLRDNPINTEAVNRYLQENAPSN